MRALMIFAVLCGSAAAQKPAPTPPAQPITEGAPNGPADREDLGHGGASYEDFLLTPAEYKEMAWTILTNGMKDKHAEMRIQTLAVLSGMGSNPRSLKMILAAFDDRDPEVRAAAALAAGETKAPMAMEALARQSGAPAQADEALRKAGWQPDPRTPETTVPDHSAESRKKLIAALKNKDTNVKVAAAKALGTFTWMDVPPALAHLMYDSKPAVRLTAAASYLETWDAMEHPPAKH